ncbi:MAG: hemolysin family protein [Opitutales bacterium]|tara:strand:- start:446 stop:1483 length:1038 start_codon:yes stop_codon:yes gene_type:complete
MIGLLLAVGFTLSTSAFCSLLEAMILSTTTAEIEALKQQRPKRGHLLEQFKEDIEETSSAILAVNTIANTLGAVLVGGFATQLFGDEKLIYISLLMTFSILLFSEILPKNVGVIYRSRVQVHLVYPLYWVRTISTPISRICKFTIRLFIREKSKVESSDEEIILLAHKSAKDGVLSQEESAMIKNALSLDDISVHEIMTPRTVVTAWDKDQTVGETFKHCPNIPFARIPVFEETIDNCCGVVRRRDLLKAKAKDQDSLSLSVLMHPTIFIPENGFVANALQECLKHQQQLAIVVDEYGSMVGVLTLEDIMELILGQEIFEKDDVAVDMRELARKKGDKLNNENLS